MKQYARGGHRMLMTIIIGVLLVAILGLVSHLTVFRGSPSPVLWWPGQQPDSQAFGTLVKPDGEEYRILLFSDIQLGLNPFANKRAFEMTDTLVSETNPHFIMTTGDNGSYIYSSPLVRSLIRRFESYQRPWGCVLGNHDAEGIADRNWLGQQYEQAEGSLFRRGPSTIHGVGNYAISVVNDAGTRLCSLVMLDSNGRRDYPQGKDYDVIYPDQIDWYASVVQALDKDGTGAPNLLFFHIPLPEMALAAAGVGFNPETPDITVETAAEGSTEVAETFGVMRERVCCAPVNSGLFDKMVAMGSTTHVFNGHDHVNNLSTLYGGIRFTYGLKTGPSCYHDADLQGGTLITLREGDTPEMPVQVTVSHVPTD